MSYDDEPAKLSREDVRKIEACLICIILFAAFCLYSVFNPRTQNATAAQTNSYQSTTTGPQQQLVAETVTTTQTEMSVSVWSVTTTSPTLLQQNLIQNGPIGYQDCEYPFNPRWCNEGGPITVLGYLVQSGSCYFIHDPQSDVYNGQDIALYNMTSTTLVNSYVQVYGYVYPNYPSGTIFPPYQPFTYSMPMCGGTPMWVLLGPIQYS